MQLTSPALLVVFSAIIWAASVASANQCLQGFSQFDKLLIPTAAILLIWSIGILIGYALLVFVTKIKQNLEYPAEQRNNIGVLWEGFAILLLFLIPVARGCIISWGEWFA
jgi:hypothetical protein